MDQFTYFHLCDHRIKKPMNDGEVTTLDVVHGKDLIDIVINGAVLLEIHEVRAIEFDPNDFEINDFYYDNPEQTYDDKDPGDSYYDDKEQFIVEYAKYFKEGADVSEPLPESFYEPVLHNRIRWLVKPPLSYRVKAKVKYTHDRTDIFAPRDCPICGGKGWFIDILDKNGTFESVKGVQKVAQRVVKDLLTDQGTQIFDPMYGTTIKKEIVENFNDDDNLFSIIRMNVSEVEDKYLTDQQEIIDTLPDDEILISLTTEDVHRSTSNPSIVVLKLRIRTSQDDQIFQLGV